MAPRPPPSRDERRRAKAGKWEVVDDFVDYLLRKRIHDELVTAGDWTEASDWAKLACASRKMVLLFVESARAMIIRAGGPIFSAHFCQLYRWSKQFGYTR